MYQINFTCIDMSQGLTRCQRLALLESNLARDINIKEMDLSVCRNMFSSRVEDCAGVVDVVVGRVVLWNRSSDHVCVCFLKYKTAKELLIPL